MKSDKNEKDKVIDFLKYAAELLQKGKISDPKLNAELILSEILSCKRFDLYINKDLILGREYINKLEGILERRLRNEPLQYILEKTYFYGYDILLNDKVFIPRQDTELIVELFLSDIKGKDDIKIYEVGTGSGCISVAVAKELEKLQKKYYIKAIDVSDDSIKTAKINMKNNNVNEKNYDIEKIDFLKLTSLDNFFNFIISNPPYVPFDEYLYLDDEVKRYEPLYSITDKKDGLSFYIKIFELLSDCQYNFILFLEIGESIKAKIESLVKYYGFKNYNFFKDCNNKFRVFKLEV